MTARLVMSVLVLATLASPAAAQRVRHGLRVPAGFEVTEFADSKLANDVINLTIDPRGRVVVSGPGYVRVLVEDKGDGKATRAIDLFDKLHDGAQGMLFEGDTLFYSADGGLRRCTIKDDKAGASELIRPFKTGGEHNIHAIRRGPDGWLYLLCGNTSGVTAKDATLATSPIKEPTAGCVVRFAPDLKGSEIVADGFRNPYGMDFNLDGELFTYDSDNERCVSLPWYAPTQMYHVIAGGHYGWQSPQKATWFRHPAYFPDTIGPLLDLGRGSPTGVACYRHVQFPEAYRGGLFLLDWTFGRVYFASLKRAGSTYAAEKQVFLEAVGEEGFAPTAAAVHPSTGDLYVSIGGRGTRGAVYRVRHTAGFQSLDKDALKKMTAPTRSLAWAPELSKKLAEQAMAGNERERLSAVNQISRHRERFDAATVNQVIVANWDYSDRHVRASTSALVASLPEAERKALAKEATAMRPHINYGLGIYATDPAEALLQGEALLKLDGHPGARVAGVRIIQLALGDLTAPKVRGTVWEGYTPRRAELDKELSARTLKALRGSFPAKNALLDREISRTLAVLQDDAPETLSRVAEQLTADSSPVEDVHYLTVLARLKAPRSQAVTARTAGALLALDAKLTKEKANRDSHWPLRIGEIHAELAAKDARLNAALLDHADFGRPDHALFAQSAGFDRGLAARIFLDRAKDADYPWSAGIVELVGELPAEQALPVLRKLWGQVGLEEAILPVLARKPEAGDRDKFLFGLTSPQLATVRRALDALDKLPGSEVAGEALIPLIQTLRRLGDSKEEQQVREQLVKYLRRATGQEKLTDKQAWADWFSKAYPKLAVRLSGPDGVDVAAWSRRLGGIDWTTGDAERGKGVFIKVSCAACHSGAQALGPDLRGVAGRFSRDDLLTAIIQPSKDISPRYRTTQIETAEGRIYQGLVVYEAVDSLILQSGPAVTVRLVNKQIAGRRFTDVSLMPAGLLDMVKDQEIADLYAYLKSLGLAMAEKK